MWETSCRSALADEQRDDYSRQVISANLSQPVFDLEAWYPRQSILCGRMASALREQMMDAELGLLSASPEQRVARAARRSA